MRSLFNLKMKKSYFKTNSGYFLPVNVKKYLIPMLTSTKKGSKYWEPPPKGPITRSYIGGKILQIHQFLSLMKEYNVSLNKKKVLDVGAGNSLISKLILEFTPIKEMVATDPYERNTHISSWQPERNDKNFF